MHFGGRRLIWFACVARNCTLRRRNINSFRSSCVRRTRQTTERRKLETLIRFRLKNRRILTTRGQGTEVVAQVHVDLIHTAHVGCVVLPSDAFLLSALCFRCPSFTSDPTTVSWYYLTREHNPKAASGILLMHVINSF